MKVARVSSPIIPPGVRWEHVIVFAREHHLDFELDPDTAAAFTFELVEKLSEAKEVNAFASGDPAARSIVAAAPERDALFFRVRNHTTTARAFVANARIMPDVDRMTKSLRTIAERDWNANVGRA